jgi:excisionase family DNA binding protein
MMRSELDERLTISVEEAGEVLGISRGAAYAAAREGTLPTVRFGRRLIVPVSRLLELLNTSFSGT